MAQTHTPEFRDKVTGLDELARLVRAARAANRTVAHCHGVFDLVHPGHIRHLEEAAALADVLVVTVTPDVFVGKGPGRPVFNERLRAETLAALQCVDGVAVNRWPTAVETIRMLRPDIYVKGADYEDAAADVTGMIDEETRAVLECGGRTHFTHDLTFSSTQLLNAHFRVLDDTSQAFLQEVRDRHGAAPIIDLLRSLADWDVTVVGDAIIDEYHYCRPYGMASKSSAVAAQLLHAESQLGGALALANHLAGFCGRVRLITCLGEQDSREELIRAGLKRNVEAHFVRRDDGPTVTKRRYVNPFMIQKMFEVAFFVDAPLPATSETRLIELIEEHSAGAKLTVVADFGNGFLGERAIAALEAAPFLAVNAQSNAVNWGYNPVTRYPRADYVCIDREEALLASRDRFAPIEEVLEKLYGQLGARMFTVTRGPAGALVRGPDRTIAVPAFSKEIVDTIGAGDAVFALTAPLARLDVEPEVLGFVGNAVGTLAVGIVGNRESIEPPKLYRLITTLLT